MEKGSLLSVCFIFAIDWMVSSGILMDGGVQIEQMIRRCNIENAGSGVLLGTAFAVYTRLLKNSL